MLNLVKNIPKLQTLVATTAKIGTDYNIPRSPITPAQLSSIYKGSVGLIFGRESIGLTNEEIQQADFVVTIPASKKYPVMNLSHSVSIILSHHFSFKSRQSSTSKNAKSSSKQA